MAAPFFTSTLQMHELMPLSLLAPGQRASVGQVLGQPEQVQRLEELGLCGGATIEMLQSGSPCIVRLSGQKLCFRADDLLRVLVHRGASA